MKVQNLENKDLFFFSQRPNRYLSWTSKQTGKKKKHLERCRKPSLMEKGRKIGWRKHLELEERRKFGQEERRKFRLWGKHLEWRKHPELEERR